MKVFVLIAQNQTLEEENRKASLEGRNPIPPEEDRREPVRGPKRRRSVKADPPTPFCHVVTVDQAIERNGGEPMKRFLMRFRGCDPNLDKVNYGHKPEFKNLEKLMLEITNEPT